MAPRSTNADRLRCRSPHWFVVENLLVGPLDKWRLTLSRLAILNDRAHPVLPLRVDLDAMGLPLKARKTAAELLHRYDEFVDGAALVAETLTGHAHRYARRIGHQHHSRDTACHLVERKTFRLPAHKLLVGL